MWSDISTDDVQTIENELGRGWVTEDTVALAVYCSLACFDNFEKATILAVNHSNDSDSTGAVTDNILDTTIGHEAFPQCHKDDLELQDIILHVADDLYRGEKLSINDKITLCLLDICQMSTLY